MDNLSMNNGGTEQDRSCDIQGFDNVRSNVGQTSKPMTPYEKPAPLVDAVTRTSNTERSPFGPSAGEITERKR
jgi:hypothetical protein